MLYVLVHPIMHSAKLHPSMLQHASTISDRLQVWTRRLCQGVNKGLVRVTAGLGEKLGEKWETNADI